MVRAKQQQTVSIDRGLFLVRYAAAEDEARPPMVKVSPSPAPNKNLSFLLHPDHSDAVLWQPGTSLVVRATAPGKLSVEVTPIVDNGSAAATVKIEPLSQGKPASPPAQAKGRSTSSDFAGIRVLGHIAGRGDVVVNANEWLAGPSAPARLEGLTIEWPDKPADVEVAYAIKTAKPQSVSGRTMPLGSFAGTRGKAMPIVALMLEISGPGAAKFQFAAEAVFLGAPVMRIVGKRIVASGPTGREPLVGLRLDLQEVRTPAKPQPKQPSGKSKGATGKVRVFRSRSKSTQAAAV